MLGSFTYADITMAVRFSVPVVPWMQPVFSEHCYILRCIAQLAVFLMFVGCSAIVHAIVQVAVQTIEPVGPPFTKCVSIPHFQ